jgi:hypothetical protein
MGPEVPVSLTGTSYQLEKFIKHTTPTGTYPINSVFSDPSYEKYRDYVVTTTISGSVSIDDQGRIDLLYFAGDEIGATYINGHLLIPTDTVVVVFHDNEWKLHAFPVSSNSFQQSICQNCGAPIFY